MQIILNITFLLLALTFTVLPMFSKLDVERFRMRSLMVTFWILFSISMLIDAVLLGLILNSKNIDSKIKIYEDDNILLTEELKTADIAIDKIAQTATDSIANYTEQTEDVKTYISTIIEDKTWLRSTSNQGSMEATLTINYPDVNISIDSIYKYKVQLYNYNCQRINTLKEQKLNTSIYKYLLYFGK